MMNSVCVQTFSPQIGDGERFAIADLTPRQAEIVRLVACGFSNCQIAQRLTLQRGTVKRHLDDIFRRIGAQCREQVVAYAFVAGLVCREDAAAELLPPMRRAAAANRELGLGG